MESQSQPIPFVEIERDEDTGKEVFKLNALAIATLQSLKEKKVAVLSVVGPQRSGKSYLANRILRKQQAFKIGSTVQSCTKGIWLWSDPVPLNDDVELLLLDTEGINSTERDKTIDTKLFCLSLLLSSMVAFNNLGHIDETAVENLSLVANLSEFISVRGEEGEKTTEKELAQYFPYFIWVLRDFSLDLKGKTPKEYMEGCLEEVASDSLEAQRKNIIRSKIKTFFKNRDCHCLVRPINDEEKLRHIEDQPYESLRPQFIQGMNTLIDKVWSNIGAKVINGKTLTGNMLLSLAFDYIDALNGEGVPEILPAVERIVYSETRKICDDVLIEYHDASDIEFNEDKMPMDEEDMQKIFKELSHRCIQKFETLTKEIADIEQQIELRNEIVEKLEKDFESKKQLNSELSLYLCKKILNEIFNTFNPPVIATINDVKESTLKEAKNQFIKSYTEYNEETKGPHKYVIFADMVPGFLFDYFDRYSKAVQKVMDEEMSQVKYYLQNARSGEDNLRNVLQEHESLIFELQKDREHYKREFEKSEREFANELRKRTNDEQFLNDKITDLEAKLDRKRKKIAQIKAEKSEAEKVADMLKLEKRANARETATLQQRVMDLEKELLAAKSSRVSNVGGGEELELTGLFSTIRSQIDGLRHSVVNSNILGGKMELSEQLLEKEKEIAKLKEEHQKVFRDLKDEYKNKLNEIKEKHNQEKNDLNKKLEKLMSENSKLKVQVIDLNNSAEIIKKKDQLLENLAEEKRMLTESLNINSSKYDTNLQVLEIHKKDVEAKQTYIGELEFELANIKALNSQLRAKKFDILYAAKEALKKALKEKKVAKVTHQLKYALEQLDEEDANEIRNALKELGIPVRY